MTKVKVNHSGSCMGYHYTKNEVISLPDDVLKALGRESYTVIDEPKKEVKKESK